MIRPSFENKEYDAVATSSPPLLNKLAHAIGTNSNSWEIREALETDDMMDGVGVVLTRK